MQLNNATEQIKVAQHLQTSCRKIKYRVEKVCPPSKYDINNVMRLQILEQKKNQIIKCYNHKSNRSSREFNNCGKSSVLDMIIPSFQAYNINSNVIMGFHQFQVDFRPEKYVNVVRPRTQSKGSRDVHNQSNIKQSLNITQPLREIQTKVGFPKTQLRGFWSCKEETRSDLKMDLQDKDNLKQQNHKSATKYLPKQAQSRQYQRQTTKQYQKQYNSVQLKFRSKNIESIIRRKLSITLPQKMDQYLRRMKLSGDTKIFIFQSPDIWLKQALLARNWTQNLDNTSQIYHLRWTSKLNPHRQDAGQLINHFYESDLITSKEGLAKVVKKSKQLSMFCPRSYDLGYEMRNFMSEFKDTQIRGLLKKIVSLIRRNLTLRDQLEANLIPYAELKNKFEELRTNSNFIDEKANHGVYLHIPYSVQLCAFCENIRCELQQQQKNPGNQLDPQSRKNLQNFSNLQPPYLQYSLPPTPSPTPSLHFNPTNINLHTPTPSSIQQSSTQLLRLIYSYNRYLQERLHTYRAEGDRNVWIVKNRNSSKGMGIYLGNQLHQIVKKTQNKLVQKYIQQCGVSSGVKYDARVWVLVLSFTPLVVYYYDQFYCRLCAEPYTLSDLQAPLSHLTNYSQNKHTYTSNQPSILTYPQLLSLGSEQLSQPIAQVEANLNKKLNKLIFETLSQYQQSIKSWPQCFELYGFDVLITDQFDLMLLQVNLSPACEAGRDVWLDQRVRNMAKGLLEIVVDKVDASRAQEMGWRLVTPNNDS